jgi:hypothetical protein
MDVGGFHDPQMRLTSLRSRREWVQRDETRGRGEKRYGGSEESASKTSPFIR